MRIAILGSVVTQVPPLGQAAIEWMAYHQAMGLAKRGHKVLLFAPEGSKVEHENIELVTVGKGGTLTGTGKEGDVGQTKRLGSSFKLRLEMTHLGILIGELLDRDSHFDILLNNLRGEAMIVPVAEILRKPLVGVMHLPLFDELAALLKRYKTNLISISDAQRKAYPDLNYAATIYNGVDPEAFAYNETPDDYYLYLGSIGPNKNPRDALLACKRAGVKMILGGRIKDKIYYDKEIASHIDGEIIKWVGEMHPGDVIELYRGAKAFLFPTMWEEPFGLVMIEAMSCGTPVVGYPHGAVAEVIEEGKNGFLVENVEEMAGKIREMEEMENAAMRQLRMSARKSVEEKFTIEKMVRNYEEVLRKILPI
ncbi:glycosyltransferase [Candidatus Gottesmanbacteria bacterium]|nr:glycosyltransferase [Candidatus Gottesmanbacteria bacterium]